MSLTLLAQILAGCILGCVMIGVGLSALADWQARRSVRRNTRKD